MINKVVITGGEGDIAQAIKEMLKDEYVVLCPGKDELDVAFSGSIIAYMDINKPDILINNAGYIKPDRIIKSTETQWIRHIEVNLIGTYLCSKWAIKYNPDVIIINIGSTAATHGRADWSAYCASKAAVVNFTQSLHDEGIRAVCISPGRTKTKMRKALFPDEDPETLLKPEHIAEIVNGIIRNTNTLSKYNGKELIIKPISVSYSVKVKE